MQESTNNQRPHILLVEDNQDQAYVVTYFLKNKGFEVEWCNTSKSAVRKAFQFNFDLILLDVMLNSEKDGFQLCEFFKSSPTIKDIPVIMLTARTALNDRINGLKLGADDYITKPFNKDELFARIEAILERKKKVKYIEQFRDLLENTDDIVLLLDLEGRIDHANKQARISIPELEKIKEKIKFVDIFEPMFTTAISTFFQRVLDGFEVKGTGWKLLNPRNNIESVDAKLLPILKGERIIGVGCILRDSSQRIKAIREFEIKNRELQKKVDKTYAQLGEIQEKLIMSEKLAVMGELSAAIAHEIRNPLNTISSSMYYIHKVLNPTDAKVLEHINIIKEEISRTQTIITNLLDFSRKSTKEKLNVDINQIINQTLALVDKEMFLNEIKINKVLNKIGSCLVNIDDIKQIFLNLFLNAKDAMPDGGTLSIKSKLDEHNRVVIEITDSGKGIPKNIIDKIFDPFFTTKDTGHGIGIGLSIVQSALERNDGTITVKSDGATGTTFYIGLPVSESV